MTTFTSFVGAQYRPACECCGSTSADEYACVVDADGAHWQCDWCVSNPLCCVCGTRILREEQAVEVEWNGEATLAHGWCSPTAEGEDGGE